MESLSDIRRWLYNCGKEIIMNLIAAVDRNWAIGKGSDLLVDIPEDKKFFREETLGKVVVMGRRTFESLPAGSLDFRTNIVLTKDRKFAPKDVCVCHCVDEVLEMVSVYDTKDVYIIGGQSVYEQFASLCDTAHITKVDYAYDADKYFPDLDKSDEWKAAMTSDEKTYFNIIYEFVKYVRVK